MTCGPNSARRTSLTFWAIGELLGGGGRGSWPAVELGSLMGMSFSGRRVNAS